MSSAYGKLYRTMALLLLAAILVLGIIFNFLLYHHNVSARESELLADCANMQAICEAYHETGMLGRNLPFKMIINSLAKLAGSDTLVCDVNGYVAICSESVQGCEHIGRRILPETVEQVFSEGEAASTMMLDQVYPNTRLAIAMPLVDAFGSRLGIVICSEEMTGIYSAQRETIGMFLTVAAAVLLLSLILMLLAARKQGKPLSKLAAAARQLGHGNLDVRLQTDQRESREYNDLVVAFNNMAVSLQTTDVQRQEFIANVSHELKTPMTTIAGYMDGMLDGTIPRDQHPYYMRVVTDEVHRLSRLVRSMLEISRMKSMGVDESRKTRFDLTDVVGQVLLGFEKRIMDKQLDVQVDMPSEPVYTLADQDAITQVVYNLMDNAIKFCNEGGLLGLQMWFTDGNKISVSISNTGETISSEELPLVFERFHKTDKSRSRNPDGAGLGLYIVKTIICGHGEDIAVESRDGRTAFYFTLPHVKTKAKEESPNGTGPAGD